MADGFEPPGVRTPSWPDEPEHPDSAELLKLRMMVAFMSQHLHSLQSQVAGLAAEIRCIVTQAVQEQFAIAFAQQQMANAHFESRVQSSVRSQSLTLQGHIEGLKTMVCSFEARKADKRPGRRERQQQRSPPERHPAIASDANDGGDEWIALPRGPCGTMDDERFPALPAPTMMNNLGHMIDDDRPVHAPLSDYSVPEVSVPLASTKEPRIDVHSPRQTCKACTPPGSASDLHRSGLGGIETPFVLAADSVLLGGVLGPSLFWGGASRSLFDIVIEPLLQTLVDGHPAIKN